MRHEHFRLLFIIVRLGLVNCNVYAVVIGSVLLSKMLIVVFFLLDFLFRCKYLSLFFFYRFSE